MDFSTIDAEFINHLESIHLCPICTSKDIIKLFSTKTINKYSHLSADVYKCSECYHWFVTPCPTQAQLVKLYESSSPYVIGEGWDSDIENTKNHCTIDPSAHVSFWFLKYIKNKFNGKYLEIGVGAGNVLAYFDSMSWEVYGIDPGPWAKGEKIFKSIESLPLGISFDLIVANDVLEHLLDPRGFLKLLSTRLNHGGQICVSVPNSSSIRAILMKRYWRSVRPFGHLHFFSMKSVAQLAKFSDLKIVRIETSELFDGGATLVLKNMLISIRRLHFYDFIRNLSYLLFSLAVLVNRGDQMKFIMEKSVCDLSTN